MYNYYNLLDNNYMGSYLNFLMIIITNIIKNN